MVSLHCNNCVIHTWVLQRRAHSGALYKFSFLYWPIFVKMNRVNSRSGYRSRWQHHKHCLWLLLLLLLLFTFSYLNNVRCLAAYVCDSSSIIKHIANDDDNDNMHICYLSCQIGWTYCNYGLFIYYERMSDKIILLLSVFNQLLILLSLITWYEWWRND